jgi:LuxR family maltose regulon positive regulatory protein
VVPRPHLIERLDEGLGQGCRLVLVSAPAGYGKTTLLSSWIAQREPRMHVAWVSLDVDDNDPARFWAYVTAALQTVGADLGESTPAVFQSPDPPPIESALTGLLNRIVEVPDPVVLVLDDYHAISEVAIHRSLSFMLENLPHQMHLVLATRADPPLPIPRLRGRGQLIELYESDLRFSSAEAATFLNQAMELQLSAADVAALDKRTEGWIAGLQMAAVSVRGRDDISEFVRTFAGSHRYVLDYLGEEVLQQQPQAVQAFLLQTAILDRLSGELCDAVIGAGESPKGGPFADSQAVLEYLERNNLFVVPLDDERFWYRYHHLFADLLRQRLQRESPGLVPELRRRASEWYEKSGQIAEAVGYALTSGDYERASNLIQQIGWTTFTRGEMATILGWMAALPEEIVRSCPQLCVLYAWAMAKSGRLDSVESCLTDAAPRCLPGEVAAVRAYVAGVRGDVSQAVELAQHALEHLPEKNLVLRAIVTQNLGVTYYWSGAPAEAAQALTRAVRLSRAAEQPFQRLTAMAILGRAQEMRGSLRQAVETYKEALALARAGRRPVPFAGMAHVGIAGPQYEWNDLRCAMQHVQEGIRLSTLGGFVAYQVFGHACLAQVLEAQGDHDAAQRAVQTAARMGQGSDYALVMALVAEVQVRLWLVQGDLVSASRWARGCAERAADQRDAAHEIEQRAVARVLVARNEPGEAVRLLARLLEAAQGAGRNGDAIKLLALQALAHCAQGNPGRALSALEQALSLAEPEGYVRTFVDEGETMASLLRQALSRGIAPNYVARLLAAFGQEPELLSPAMGSLIEPLTERELDVLRLVVAGLSNSEIADQLIIATSTVKSHINRIYGKLEVENRAQAVIKTQDLALL